MLDTSTTDRNLLMDCLQGLDAGVVVLDDSLRVLWTTDAARNILDSGDGLRQIEGRLATAAPADMAALEAAVADVHKTGRPVVHAVERSSGAWALLVNLVPSRTPDAIMAFITDPAADIQNLERFLIAGYGLTRAEAQVSAMLVHGADLAQIAKRRGVGVATVRTQINHVFEKTGTRRQVDLVRLVLRGAVCACRHAA